MQEIMTAKEVAEYLKVHHLTILRAIKDGKLEAKKIGRTYRITKEQVEVYLKKE